MKRILIEFFSRRTADNLISLTHTRYDGVIYLSFGCEEEPSVAVKGHFSESLKKRCGITPSFETVSCHSIEAALAFFNRLPSTASYDFDITGGSEVFIAAAGFFVASHPERALTIHQYDPETGRRIFRYPSRQEQESVFPVLFSVPEYLSMNGSLPLSVPKYQFSIGPLKREVLRLWHLTRRHSRDWNNFCNLPEDDQLPALPHNRHRKYTGEENGRLMSGYRRISEILKKAGILTDEKREVFSGKVYHSFRLALPEEAQFLYEKAGNLLELYTACAAEESGAFHDIRVGVSLDWDGTVPARNEPNPRNEVDLILMWENTPVVVSCKNTAPQNDNLYEIMIMAKHYGGAYSVPVLLSTRPASPTVAKRAEEMEILLVDGVESMQYDNLVRLFSEKFPRRLP